MMRHLQQKQIKEYERYLQQEEKSAATVEKYIRDIRTFAQWLHGRQIDKQSVLEYKNHLTAHYAVASVNSILSSLNSFFSFCRWHDLHIRTLKVQKQIFADQTRELSKAEYLRLLQAAQQQKNERLYLLMQTICSTGIRISELQCITTDTLQKEKAMIRCKGKMRVVLLPKKLCKMLWKYVKKEKIIAGSVFQTKSGKPMDRSNIWAEMKKLCRIAKVSRDKVFPHNLRHLFARTYYAIQKDVVRLADILGHSSVNTTRIYTMESGQIHQQQIQKLGLLRC